jgi:hypothetical protein
MEVTTIELLALLLGPTGAAWVGVRAGLNGAKQDIKDIKNDSRDAKIEMKELSRAILDNRIAIRELQIEHRTMNEGINDLYKDGCTQLQRHLSLLHEIERTRD